MSFPVRPRRQAGRAAQRAAREEPARHRGAAARKLDARPRPAIAVNARTSDGMYNDLTCPRMGSAGMRFGRNVPLSETFPDTANLMNPNPRRVSLELLTRTTFQPATILNVLAAAWIQFQVHDWFVHKKGVWSHTHDIPVDAGDTWHEQPDARAEDAGRSAEGAGFEAAAGLHQREHALVGRLAGLWQHARRPDVAARRPRRQGARQPARTAGRRSGHRPRDHRLHRERLGRAEPAAFACSRSSTTRSAIGCGRHNLHWDDERLFQQARLVNAALLAKIHTVEWSTAILPAKITITALRTNWYGLARQAAERLHRDQRQRPARRHSRVADRSPRHAVLADRGVRLRLPHAHADAGRLHHQVGEDRRRARPLQLPELSGRAGVELLQRIDQADLFYSFGIAHPGAVRLHNYPKTLQNLVNDNGERFDLGTIDILRDRERGVPRYNQFRRLLHKSPIKSFDEITDVPQWADEIKRVYDNDLEKVDTMVGLMARAAARRLRLQRHGVPRLPADGVAPAEERSLPVEGLSPGGLHEGRHRVGRGDVDDRRHHAPLPVAGAAMKGLDNAFQPWKR